MFDPDEQWASNSDVANTIAAGMAEANGADDFLGGILGDGMIEKFAGPLLSGLGGALASPAGPSNAQGGRMGDQMFDNSGWNVNFGEGNIESSRAQTDPIQAYVPYVVLGLIALVAWKAIKRK